MNFINTKYMNEPSNITRKEFLRVGAALPFALHSLMMKAAARDAAGDKAGKPPKRIMFICNSLGFYAPYFFPKTKGDLASSDYLRTLRVKDKATVYKNLFHPGMETSNHSCEKSFLTGAPYPEATAFVNSISLDQVIAHEIGGHTRFPFLPLSIYDRGWGCSWNSRGVAIPPMHDETEIFNTLFGEEDLAGKQQQITNDKNILACLYRDMAELRRGGANGAKLDSYRSVIGELEAQLKHEEFWMHTKKPVVANSLSNDMEYKFVTKIDNLLELSKLAFRTDSTRVITFSMDWIDGAIKVPGVSAGWHTLSHHGGNPDKLDKLSRVERAIMGSLDRFLFELDQIPEGDGTLLDSTTVVIGSCFGDASHHTHNNLPTVVVGGGYRHQAQTVLEKPTPLCNLYLELLHKFNIDAGTFGNSERDMGLLKG